MTETTAGDGVGGGDGGLGATGVAAGELEPPQAASARMAAITSGETFTDKSHLARLNAITPRVLATRAPLR